MARCWILDGPHLRIADALLVSFQRTRQVTDPRTPLPPKSYGALPIALAPSDAEPARVLLPVGEGEAVWLGLRAIDPATPAALRVAVEEPALVDAVTGERWSEALASSPQNYVVCPPQGALDGVQRGPSRARQFARIPSSGLVVACRRLKLVALLPVGARPHRARLATAPRPLNGPPSAADVNQPNTEIGVFQEILPDPYGVDAWSNEQRCEIRVDVVSPLEYSAVTGEPPLPPLDRVTTYGGWRLP